jgi:hypothetical protein
MIVMECGKEFTLDDFEQFTAGVETYLYGFPCFSDNPAFRKGYEEACARVEMDLCQSQRMTQ